ncbi:branched-chain amino acid ABC transporter permease [Alloalcanivorax mobilis]|uniref:branched-chain amino acid ABC transporter permease n=1 Tax=Alloalcanivorax mobilis TaxID=2019569 RepID=UPI000B5B3317|nr:branched-chain amino acid ABC transporter permease [Alloalcanivorax mobilis]ASK35365.1 branched-chain amino acid ABC transporter permease [Alcanivorax sp. N3-2A]|tara:strand:+ start:11024 stop:12010 length:987 start_codon:yes stop_codon:yes gene_type:complete
MKTPFLRSPYAGLLLLALVLALMPFLVRNDFHYDLLTKICLTATVAVGLNLLVGYAGQVSLGHAAFYAGGAYASAILTSQYQITPLPAMLIAAAGVGVIAWLVGRPILHLKGHYLSMATLGLGVIAAIVLNNEDQLTGGPDGIGLPPLSLLGHELSVFGEYPFAGLTLTGVELWYLLAAAVLLLAVLLALNIIDSPLGRALRALHGSEIAAQVAGVDTARFKLRVFVISAVYASVAGSLYGHYSGFITPGIASFEHSIELITIVVLGGMASTFGVIIGAVILVLIPQFLTDFQELEMVVFGAILMAVMIFLPRGLLPTLLSRFQRGAR